MRGFDAWQSKLLGQGNLRLFVKGVEFRVGSGARRWLLLLERRRFWIVIDQLRFLLFLWPCIILIQPQTSINNPHHLLSILVLYTSINGTHLYPFLLPTLFLHFPSIILAHLIPQLIAQRSRSIDLRLHDHASKHAAFEITNASLVLCCFFLLPTLKFLHLLHDLLLVIFEFSLALKVLVPIYVVEYAFSFSEGLDLVSITLIILHQSAMAFIQAHILLIPPLDLFIIPFTIELLLLHLLCVSLLFLLFYFPDLFLELSFILHNGIAYTYVLVIVLTLLHESFLELAEPLALQFLNMAHEVFSLELFNVGSVFFDATQAQVIISDCMLQLFPFYSFEIFVSSCLLSQEGTYFNVFLQVSTILHQCSILQVSFIIPSIFSLILKHIPISFQSNAFLILQASHVCKQIYKIWCDQKVNVSCIN